MLAIYKIIDSSKSMFDLNNLEIVTKCNNIKNLNKTMEYVNKYHLLENGWSPIINLYNNDLSRIIIDIESDNIDQKIYPIIRDLKIEQLL